MAGRGHRELMLKLPVVFRCVWSRCEETGHIAGRFQEVSFCGVCEKR